MKFLNSIKLSKNNLPFEEVFLSDSKKIGLEFKYKFKRIKNRKNSINIRPGVTKNFKKNSIKRDNNLNLLQQYINLNFRKGKKTSTLKNLNKTFENINYSLSNELNDFKVYKKYLNLTYFYNIDPRNSDLNTLLKYIVLGFESIFEIKISKNNKKKTKTNRKYLYEIIYIPKERRIKHALNALSIYKEYFKNYNLWERIFWSLFLSMLNKENSFLKKRREFIYSKSVKFFRKKKNNKKIN